MCFLNVLEIHGPIKGRGILQLLIEMKNLGGIFSPENTYFFT